MNLRSLGEGTAGVRSATRISHLDEPVIPGILQQLPAARFRPHEDSSRPCGC